MKWGAPPADRPTAFPLDSNGFRLADVVGRRGALHRGHPDLALTHHEQALRYAIDLAPEDLARAHDGPARAHLALDQPDLARSHW